MTPDDKRLIDQINRRHEYRESAACAAFGLLLIVALFLYTGLAMTVTAGGRLP